jgi:hypothetical protein
MAKNNKHLLAGSLGIPGVLLSEIIIFAMVMALFLVEGGGIIIAEIVIGGLILLDRKSVV